METSGVGCLAGLALLVGALAIALIVALAESGWFGIVVGVLVALFGGAITFGLIQGTIQGLKEKRSNSN